MVMVEIKQAFNQNIIENILTFSDAKLLNVIEELPENEVHNTDIVGALFDKLSELKNNDINIAIAKSPYLKYSIKSHSKLAEYGDYDARYALSENTALRDPEAQRILANDKHENVRSNLARNTALSDPETVLMLAKDSEDDVHGGIKTRLDELEEIMPDTVSEIRQMYIDRENALDHLLSYDA